MLGPLTCTSNMDAAHYYDSGVKRKKWRPLIQPETCFYEVSSSESRNCAIYPPQLMYN
jgi:hypothetical protein